MALKILVPMDDSEMATKALEFAIDVHPHAEITVLHVVGGLTPFMGGPMGLALADDIDGLVQERSEDIFENVQRIAAEHDTEIRGIIRLGQPPDEIVEQAKKFDLVVIGAHTRDIISRVLIGNVAATVVRKSPVPVTVVR